MILTHRRDDAHQDHREVCQLTWNLFRDHLILEYEIPKWDGDLGQPNVYVPLTCRGDGAQDRAAAAHFGTQRSKDWFDAETFRGLARLRGMECRAPERYAEAFVTAQGPSRSGGSRTCRAPSPAAVVDPGFRRPNPGAPIRKLVIALLAVISAGLRVERTAAPPGPFAARAGPSGDRRGRRRGHTVSV